MSELTPEADLEARARLLKALGHPVRLLILNLAAMSPRHGEELADILGLNPATISFHLNQLTAVGLLSARKDQYYQTYSLVEAPLQKSLFEVVRLPQPGLKAQVEEDAFRAKVLRAFVKHGRLTRIPAQLKKRQVILKLIVQEFEPGRDYSELEINRILLEFHEDVGTLRRELVGHDLLERAGGIYRRAVGGEGSGTGL